jgi:cytochrome P450
MISILPATPAIISPGAQGVHICGGMHRARIEMEVLLEALVEAKCRSVLEALSSGRTPDSTGMSLTYWIAPAKKAE